MIVATTNREVRAAEVFKALSDPTRLKIMGYLMCCPEYKYIDEDGGMATEIGATVGAVCCHIEGKPGEGRPTVSSRISHHIKELKNAGVIHVERRGRFMVCRINEDAVQMISEFADALKTCCGEAKK
jgi:DNA-binding transcriptional ArsR family regulator